MLKRTRRSPFLYIFQFTFREEGKGGERERGSKEKGKIEGGRGGRKKNERERKRREEASRLQQRIPDIWPTKKNLFSVSTNSTHKLTYRDSLLLLYLVFEQELWLASEVEEDEEYVGKYECQRRKHSGT